MAERARKDPSSYGFTNISTPCRASVRCERINLDADYLENGHANFSVAFVRGSQNWRLAKAYPHHHGAVAGLT
jgi:hypothetical protein